tara:strand:- start:2237 stop:2554 length:318 start_codon:yes stop_codon:yes gene_type:complete
MGILDNNLITPTAAEAAATSLVKITKNSFSKLVHAYEAGVDTFWDNPEATPQEIANVLGTDASEVFSLHYKIGQLVASLDADVLSAATAKVGTFVQNEDGTVTIT